MRTLFTFHLSATYSVESISQIFYYWLLDFSPLDETLMQSFDDIDVLVRVGNRDTFLSIKYTYVDSFYHFSLLLSGKAVKMIKPIYCI